MYVRPEKSGDVGEEQTKEEPFHPGGVTTI
jgi:hypothetical protein